MKIDAGALDRKIELMTVTKQRDAYGQAIDTNTVLATVWGQRLEMRTVDVARLAGKEATSVGRYLIRWRAGVSAGVKARVDGLIYKITGVEEPDRRRTLIITVEEAA